MVRPLILALFACAATAAGCAGPGGSGDGITLQVFADAEEAKAYRALIDAFQRTEPDAAVRLIPVADQGDHVSKLATAFSAGSPPDLFLLNYRRFGQFAEAGVLAPLGPRIAERGVLDVADLYPEAVDAFRFGGELACVPQNVSTPVVYYNRALFERAGLTGPPEGWTWEVMLNLAVRLTEGDVRGLTFEPSLNRFAPFVWQAGGEVTDDLEDPSTVSLTEDPDLEALTFLTDLQRRYRVVPSPAEYEGEDPEARFAAGRAAMLIESRRAVTALRAAPDLDFDVAPLPVHSRVREPAVMLHADAYCMAEDSEHQDQALRFVEFALGEEGSRVLARTGRTVPARRSVAQSDAFLDPAREPRSAQVFLDQIPAIRRFPNIGAWNEVEKKADVAIEEWFFGREDPRELGFEIDIATGRVTGPGT